MPKFDISAYSEVYGSITGALDTPSLTDSVRQFLLKPSIFGSIRWPRALGRPLRHPLTANFQVTYVGLRLFGGASVPFERQLLLFEASDEDEFVVAFHGPNVVEGGEATHNLLVRLLEPEAIWVGGPSVAAHDAVPFWTPFKPDSSVIVFNAHTIVTL